MNDRFERTFRVYVTCMLTIAVVGFVMIFPGPIPERHLNGTESLLKTLSSP